MTSVPPTQPPAAPETDVRLTEAECNRLTNFLEFYTRGVESISGLVEEVAGIVAERVRVVEGERDAARAGQRETWKYVCEIAQVIGIEPDDVHPMDAVDRLTARAESAEAAHRALQAAVEALADEWEADFMAYRHDNPGHLRLRALLAGGEER